MRVSDLFDTAGSLAVNHTKELDRVLAIPRRDAMALGKKIAGPLTQRLKARYGTMVLRPLQALALVEAHDLRGLICMLPVGEGKTLITFLLPTLLKAKKPLLVVPAKLREKTKREFTELVKHWRMDCPIEIISYDLISRRADVFRNYKPDLLICDEAHKLKNIKAACTKRVRRYLKTAGEDCVYVDLSGTIADRSFKDWWHRLGWALPAGLRPLPQYYSEMAVWCEALDEKLEFRRPLGALTEFGDTLDKAREGFGKLVAGVPGIITKSVPDVSASLYIELIDWEFEAVADAFADMRKLWTTPGGIEFEDAVGLWQHARELSNGFCYEPVEPLPPDWWMRRRRDYHQFIRGILKGSHKYDTPAQIAEAYKDFAKVAAWREVKDMHKVKTKPVWLSYDFMNGVVKWLSNQQKPVLVWVEHTATGELLQERYGIEYFAGAGRSSQGNHLLDQTGTIALSVTACREGFNLQKNYSCNMILNCTPKGTFFEQLCGRTHRYGQEADVVEVFIPLVSIEQRQGFEQACADARYIETTTNQKQKLCYADIIKRGKNVIYNRECKVFARN